MKKITLMLLSLVLFCSAPAMASAGSQNDAQARFVTMDFKNVSLSQTINVIVRSTGINASCTETLGPVKVSVCVKNMQALDVLKLIARMIDARVVEKDGAYLIEETRELGAVLATEEGASSSKAPAVLNLTLDLKNLSLGSVVKIISRCSGAEVGCSDELSDQKITVSAKDQPVKSVLDLIASQLVAKVVKTSTGYRIE
ncbi:MAG: hypothetical protein PHW04_16915 [Candidatus Wallbacteria bacterium]|nr:hypothetical protein [Candidatus Wallbacteria bacterium]